MGTILAALGPMLGFGEKLIEKLIPDPQAQAEAKLKLAVLAQNGELESMRIGMSAILAEAQSADPWTSRARPSFMYVMYAFILSAIPMGVLFVFSPESAVGVATGVQAWLKAIPGELYALFGAGYLGYGTMRSFEKGKGVSK